MTLKKPAKGQLKNKNPKFGALLSRALPFTPRTGVAVRRLSEEPLAGNGNGNFVGNKEPVSASNAITTKKSLHKSKQFNGRIVSKNLGVGVGEKTNANLDVNVSNMMASEKLDGEILEVLSGIDYDSKLHSQRRLVTLINSGKEGRRITKSEKIGEGSFGFVECIKVQHDPKNASKLVVHNSDSKEPKVSGEQILARKVFDLRSLVKPKDEDVKNLMEKSPSKRKRRLLEKVTDEITRIEMEIYFLSTCKSEFIVGFEGWEVYNESKQIAIYLEACEVSVGHLIETGHVLTIEQIQAVTTCVVLALDHLHHAGIVHLDIKPDNVLLSGVGVAKVCDFGVSTMKLEAPSMLRFTPAYCSPELLSLQDRLNNGSKINHESYREDVNAELHRYFRNDHASKSDVWSLGMMVLDMLLCVTPFTYMGFATTKDKLNSSLYSLQIGQYESFLQILLQEGKDLQREWFPKSIPDDAANPVYAYKYAMCEFLEGYDGNKFPLTGLLLNFLNACLRLDYRSRSSVSELLKQKFVADSIVIFTGDSRDKYEARLPLKELVNTYLAASEKSVSPSAVVTDKGKGEEHKKAFSLAAFFGKESKAKRVDQEILKKSSKKLVDPDEAALGCTL